MLSRLVVVLAVGCSCSASTSRTSAPPAEAAPTSYELPAASEPPAFHPVCRTFGPPPATYLPKVVYDFAPLALYPIRRGLQMSERPRTGFAHPVSELRGVITRHADVARVMIARAPWLDDGRVFGAFANLATALHGLSPQAAAACAARAEDAIARFTRSDKIAPRAHTMTTTWLARYAAVIPLAAHLRGGNLVAWRYAESLALTDRRAEGVARLRALVPDPDIGAAVAVSLRTLDGDPDAGSCGE